MFYVVGVRMPVQCWIEKEEKIIRMELTGNVVIEDIFGAFNQSINDPDFEKGFDILSDHTKVGVPISADKIRMSTSQLEMLRVYMSGSRWASVVSTDLCYGMMRIFAVHLEKIPIWVEIFRSFEGAETWLKGSRSPADSTHYFSQFCMQFGHTVAVSVERNAGSIRFDCRSKNMCNKAKPTGKTPELYDYSLCPVRNSFLGKGP